jgi:CDP-4-dehydro-6-deoxyglucose reductase
MTHQIKLIPSNHAFEADENESLLDAALRSGLNISYSCTTGGCGECKAHVLSGEYQFIASHDYKLTEAEKGQNVILMCSVNAKSDLLIEAKEARTAADIPQQRITARIAKLEKIDSEHIVLHVRTPRSQTLRFLAGQYATLSIDGVPPCDVAMASCPCNGMTLQFHVQRDDDDEFAHYVFHNLSHGGNVLIEGPYGDFTLDEDSRRPVVMVAQDTGFAPLKSLVEHAIALDLPQSMILFWVASADKTHYLSNYCRSWEDALDRFVYIPLMLSDKDNLQDAYSEAVQQIIDRSLIESEIDLYLATPSPLGNLIAETFAARGTPRSRIAITSTC